MILIVDDERHIRSSLSGLLEDEGYRTLAVESAEKAEAALADQPVEVVLLDIQMSGKDGLTFLDDNREQLGDIPVIVISGRGDIPTAVAAMKLGGYDYIEKPLAPERVLVTVQQAMRLARSLRSEKKLVGHILEKYEMIGDSRPLAEVRRMIEKAAGVDSPVLITGENGTGKELVVRHVHYLSPRKGDALVIVNCPAIPEQLFESELFGHTKGAFTGADRDRTGRFEKADRGTIFLDEIGDLPMVMQGKLLRVLETGEFEKIGSDKTISVDCRLLAATNRDLEQMVAEGKFRQDLYYRINVLHISVPPLRDRAEDIPLLLEYFLKAADATGEFAFSPDAIGVLAAYDWPGNIRQFRNVVQQIIIGCESGPVDADDIRRVTNLQRANETDMPDGAENRLTAAIRNFEAGYLSHLYRKHQGNIASMARELNMDRGNLSRKLKQLGIV
jgi:two-component system, NtrC family, nitrogen regulation response regulator NtrX